MRCAKCAMQWDTNDPEPPQCGMADLGVREANRAQLRQRFERHAVSEHLSLAKQGSDYASPITIAAWNAYQAAYALPRL